MKRDKVLKMLEAAQDYANQNSKCKKVAVGSAICINDRDSFVIYGANTTLPGNCIECGCQREKLYGENSKEHRLPSDCRAVHSEIDAICGAARFGMSVKNASIVITRYPCEACARAIVRAGIFKVYYGRQQEISEQTKKIFEEGNVSVEWVKEWKYEDTTQ